MSTKSHNCNRKNERHLQKVQHCNSQQQRATTTHFATAAIWVQQWQQQIAAGRAFMRQLHVSLSGTFRDCMQTTSDEYGGRVLSTGVVAHNLQTK